MELNADDHAYAPVGGLLQLRDRVADFNNRTFRRGRSSQYTAENVCIAPGGRAAMARVVASLAPMNLGHFIPDYTDRARLFEGALRLGSAQLSQCVGASATSSSR